MGASPLSWGLFLSWPWKNLQVTLPCAGGIALVVELRSRVCHSHASICSKCTCIIGPIHYVPFHADGWVDYSSVLAAYLKSSLVLKTQSHVLMEYNSIPHKKFTQVAVLNHSPLRSVFYVVFTKQMLYHLR